MNIYFLSLILLISTTFQSISARRSVSSRDWGEQEDGPEHEIIPPPKPHWNCTFEGQDCGVVNDQLIGQYFQLSKTQLSPLVDKRHVFLLNITRIESNPSGARLITPYFETKRHSKGITHLRFDS